MGGTTSAQALCEVNDGGPRGVLDRNLFGTPCNGQTTVTFHLVVSFSRDVRVPFPHFGFVDLLFKICDRHRKQNRGMPQSPARWQELCFGLFFVLVSRETDDTGVYHNLRDKVCHKTSTIDIEKCQIVAVQGKPPGIKHKMHQIMWRVPQKLECCNCRPDERKNGKPNKSLDLAFTTMA